jgi:hypothetical protein
MLYISVNAHTIRRNARSGTSDPPIRIARSKSDKKPLYVNDVEVVGGARLRYSADKPILKCGARLVLECEEVRTKCTGADRYRALRKPRCKTNNGEPCDVCTEKWANSDHYYE